MFRTILLILQACLLASCLQNSSNSNRFEINTKFSNLQDSLVLNWGYKDFCSFQYLADSFQALISVRKLKWCNDLENKDSAAFQLIRAILLKDSSRVHQPNIRYFTLTEATELTAKYNEYKKRNGKYRKGKEQDQGACLFNYQMQAIEAAKLDTNTIICLGLDSLDLLFQVGYDKNGCAYLKKFYNPPMIKWFISDF